MMTGTDDGARSVSRHAGGEPALMTGDSHVMFNALPSALPYVKEGKVRGLAVTTSTRQVAA
jgi:tripartite-type tricarboxylate transporter receptor subunit TctC